MTKLIIDNFKDQIHINEIINGQTVLHMCHGCHRCSNLDIAKFIIDNFKDQIDINVLSDYDDDFGEYECWTVLHAYCYYGNYDMAKLIIDNFKNKIDIKLKGIYYDDGFIECTFLDQACINNDIKMTKLIIDNFKDQINMQLESGSEILMSAMEYCKKQDNFDIFKLLIDNFKDSIDIMLLNGYFEPMWWDYFKDNDDSANFKDLFLPLLLNRDKSKDPQGLTPLHIAYLLRKQYGNEKVLDYLLSIPALVDLDGSQRDKFQTLPHQVTPLPPK